MRLTEPCVFGTLLAFLNIFWTIADSDEGDHLEAKGFGPCAATLQTEALCREGQDENTCPYLFNLPPLTVHLPKQLGELEKIMKDLQKLKDNVDELRKMCTDCTVSQTERECVRQRERAHVKLNEGTGGHDESNCMNEKNPERLTGFEHKRQKENGKVENSMEEDGNTDSTILEERGRKKLEAERKSDRGLVKENEQAETLKEVVDRDGKIQTEGAKDKLKLTDKPTTVENEGIVDTPRERIVEKSNSETERNKENYRKWDSNEDLEKMNERKTVNKNEDKTEEREDEAEETDKTKEDKSSDGTKMSGEHTENTNREWKQHKEERKKKTEKGIKVERNNEKPKQTESIRRAEKEKKAEEGSQTGKENKTEEGGVVQSVLRGSDGELGSKNATERTDLISISPTPQSTISSAPRHDMDQNEATMFMSSPPLSSSHLLTDINKERMTAADGLSTKNTDIETPEISEHSQQNTETGIRATSSPETVTMKLLGGSRKQITSPTTRVSSTTSLSPNLDVHHQVSFTMTTTNTTTSSQTLYTTIFPGVADRSSQVSKINSSTNTKTVMKPGQGVKPGEKHKPGIKPETGQKLKNPKNEQKQTKYGQKQRPSHQKPTADLKPRIQIPKPDQSVSPDILTTDQNLKITEMPKHDKEHTNTQDPKSHRTSKPPVQGHTSHHTPATLNKSSSDKDPLNNQDPESVVIQQNPKPDKKLHHPLQTNRQDQKQKPAKEPNNVEKTNADQMSEPNHNFTAQFSAQEPEPESEFAPKPEQKSVTELTDSDENHPPEPEPDSGSTPEQKMTPDRINIPPDHKPKFSQKNVFSNQNPKPEHAPKPSPKHPESTTSQETKNTNVKSKPSHPPQTNQGLKSPWSGQMPNLNPKSVPEAESNKTSRPKPPSGHRPPTRPSHKPGATSVQKQKPAEKLKPSPKTETGLDPPHISGTTSDGIQISQTDMPPPSGPIKPTAVTLGPKTSSSLETRPFPFSHDLPKGSTMSPNSRTTSDLRPQTASHPSSIPMTTRPNKIIHGILPRVISSTTPGYTKLGLHNTDPSDQVKILQTGEETGNRPGQPQAPDIMMTPVSPPSPQTASALSADLRSTTPDPSGPELPTAESSTPSARELRVKINQVAAFLNSSLSPNGQSVDRRPKELPEYVQGGSRPDQKLSPRIPLKVKRDCSDHLLRGAAGSGVYLVTPDLRSKSFPVYCDMEAAGGGWTVLQRRQDGSVSFNRSWAEYRAGFGELAGGEFWLGNNMIHLLTRDRDMVLRVELQDFDGLTEYAEYDRFKVAGERLRYRLTVGGYSGTAGDALRFSKTYDHNNRPFTTPDRDNDRYPSGNCGAYYSSGWWFDACMAANLNGRYYVGKYTGVRDGIFWGTWRNISSEYYPTSDRRSFKTARMMIRPKGFEP
ncbi:proteoglycan 4-like [Echeneis naucrates]|uniref:Proteoglycan 4-like n=1 Tax=Echeneis naucrates TaxID=173247 RepID=A0A665TSM8_ECHNA|nr:proteoglycan 4-like [Echeneis naucrates]